MLLADVIDGEVHHDLRVGAALQRRLHLAGDQIAGDRAGGDGDLLDVVVRRQELADLRQVAAQERLAAAHDDEEQVAHRRERLLDLLERQLVLLVLAELLPVEAGAAEGVAVVGQAEDQVDRLHAALVDQISEVLRLSVNFICGQLNGCRSVRNSGER